MTSLRGFLIARCSEPACSRRGVCLPALDFPNGHEAMTREDAVPERLDRLGYALHTESYQAFFPLRGSVKAAAMQLRRTHQQGWRLACLRCLALRYIKQRIGPSTGEIFGTVLSAKLRGLRRRTEGGRAVDRLLPPIDEYIINELRSTRQSTA